MHGRTVPLMKYTDQRMEQMKKKLDKRQKCMKLHSKNSLNCTFKKKCNNGRSDERAPIKKLNSYLKTIMCY